MIRTRFAPSPTGYLHIGAVRTALFCWLFARRHQGRVVLRIEDTDAVRSTQEAIQVILDGMNWLGLDWDEGPFYQTEHYDLYRQEAARLLREGKAYKCYCTPEELEAKRQRAIEEGRTPRYDRTCRERSDLPDDRPFTLRFKTPLEGATTVTDVVQGEVTFRHEDLDDLIIQRTDGSPTYNFCVVVDDARMKISHVIRGNDHLSNTPKQILLYNALGAPVPHFAHIPLILGKDRSKLSKRHAATSVLSYRDGGYLPEALVNYLVRLGWSHGDQEIFTLQEMIENFSLEGVGKSSGIFDTEKLLWLNHHYIKKADPKRLAFLLLPLLKERYEVLYSPVTGDTVDENSPWLWQLIEFQKERSKTLIEMADALGYYFVDNLVYDEKAAQKNLRPVAADLMEEFLPRLEAIETFTTATLEDTMRQFLEIQGIKMVKIAQPIRVSITGGSASPGLFDVMVALGKDTVLKRIRQAVEWIRTKR
ncbi:glutamate--tRNA ligase [candidate division KSB3 bacterium]|uniref:Glutamate--tRNA ligase n=1 Tax=candidate division KSB3 bacterium TaxID=2044937 RepID=A0A2G6E7G5_9BACT|nr:MAG: glutamate--tRNA ligase [candidate division KSB3 bacterium]PIE30359.1 MAG: glutamate--tRNA ligase [candidate division KSB3 bacterium]